MTILENVQLILDKKNDPLRDDGIIEIRGKNIIDDENLDYKKLGGNVSFDPIEIKFLEKEYHFKPIKIGKSFAEWVWSDEENKKTIVRVTKKSWKGKSGKYIYDVSQSGSVEKWQDKHKNKFLSVDRDVFSTPFDEPSKNAFRKFLNTVGIFE